MRNSKKSAAVATRRASARTSGRPAIEVADDLRKAQEKLENTSTWQDAYPAAANRVSGLLDELEISQLKELPDGEPISKPGAIKEVSIEHVQLDGNHREHTKTPADDPEMLQLQRSLKMAGLIEPIGVIVNGKKFVLIWGSRRLEAARRNDWKDIEARVYPSTITADEIELLRTIENFDHKTLTPVEEAIAVARNIDVIERILKAKDFDEHQQNLAKRVEQAGGIYGYAAIVLGRPEKWVRDHAYVHKLSGLTRELLAQRRLNLEHARELAKIGNPEVADKLAKDVARDANGLGGKDLNYLKQQVMAHVRSLRTVPWRLEVAFGADKKLGCNGWACSTCPFNTKSDPILFETAPTDGEEPTEAAGTCTNEVCFEVKMKTAERDIAKAIDRARPAVKKDKLAITETALAHLIPITIRGNTFIRRAKAMIEPETGKTPSDAKNRSASGAKKDRNAEPEITPEQKAKNAHQEALNVWKAAACKKLADAIVKTKGGIAFYLLASNAQFFDKMREWGLPWDADRNPESVKQYRAKDAAARRIANQSQTISILKRFKNPQLKDFLALEKSAFKPNHHDLTRLVDDAIINFSEVLGLKLPAPPVLELPEEPVAAE